ncbi:hypothetical protein F5I97DRAFT_134074 [Phlebopus sp. FC_14]|nr:hypothetical protein F5I97DRAFT_134074 [Phlebopus sp. FC_14]
MSNSCVLDNRHGCFVMTASFGLNPETTSTLTKPKCPLLEIAILVQYSCESEKLPNGRLRPHCFPVSRLFRMCPERPAVEITRFCNVDIDTGAVELPDDRTPLPEGKLWRDVHLHSKNRTG